MTRLQTVFMFSGQGSHYYHMGRELFEREATFRRWMLEMDAIVREQGAPSVLEELYSPTRTKNQPFERLLLTHPAIFMIEFALAQTLITRNVVPDCTLGVSMGSFAAAVVAGCATVDDALTCLLHHARQVEAHCRPGGMIAVLAEPALYGQDCLQDHHCEIAAENFSSHFVVSAPQEYLGAIEARLKSSRTVFQRLAVGYPFHSRWLEDARDVLLAATGELSFKAAQIPLVCCEQGTFVGQVSHEYFWNVARRRIQFARTIDYMESRGTYRYIDVGPAGSLATFLKYALPSRSTSRVSSILSPFGGDLRNLELAAVH